MNIQFIDAGTLSSALALLCLQPEYDDSGSYSEQWNEIANLWGKIEPVRAQAVQFAGQALNMITHRITVRYREDLRNGMRLQKNSRIFTVITSHDPDETGRYLICLAKEETE